MLHKTKKPQRAEQPEQAGAAQPLPQGDFAVYVAARGFEHDLLAELGKRVLAQRGRLVLARGARPAAWAHNVWLRPQWLPIQSVGDAVRQLKGIQRNWSLHIPPEHIRRAKLIQEQLPHVSAKAQVFGQPMPAGKLGAWTLWTPELMLASPATTSPYADGEVLFEENKIDPPGRAYLKLWEVFTLLQCFPQAGELCLDLGASPGGWSWVLGKLGATVLSIDKAPLAPQVAALPTVSSCQGSGFELDPRDAGAVDWLFSDMICYPTRLLEAVQRWLAHGQCRNYVCTLKFQAETDYETAQAFAAIPGSRLLHLSCNKHELTWVNLACWREAVAQG
jgi:23S rRNA (cytidine2498-2'-O)-methyltransferase